MNQMSLCIVHKSNILAPCKTAHQGDMLSDDFNTVILRTIGYYAAHTLNHFNMHTNNTTIGYHDNSPNLKTIGWPGYICTLGKTHDYNTFGSIVIKYPYRKSVSGRKNKLLAGAAQIQRHNMKERNTPVFDVTDGPAGHKYVAYSDFINQYKQDPTRSLEYAYMNFDVSLERIQEVMDLVRSYCKENSIIYTAFSKSMYAYTDDFYFNCGYGDEQNTSVYQLEIVGDETKFNHIFDYLRKKELKFKKIESLIKWFYMDANGICNKTIRFEKNPNKIRDIYYPFIEGGAVAYMRKFLKSDASVLVMIGDPGTGKTSLVRDFLYRNKLQANLTFDERVIGTDDFFVTFLTDKAADVLVMEDADTLIGGRIKERNMHMDKFLNISDGLVPHKGKKMIFTTNLSSVDYIDPALIRPGRCFGVLNFRKLTLEEANIIRNTINKPPIHKKAEKDKYTLADAFCEIHSNIEQTKKQKIGII